MIEKVKRNNSSLNYIIFFLTLTYLSPISILHQSSNLCQLSFLKSWQNDERS